MQTYECPDWMAHMPKVEIHRHLGGGMRLQTVLELADKFGVQLPAKDEPSLQKIIFDATQPPKSLEKYLAAIKICESVLLQPEAFSRAAYEACDDNHKENVNVFELRFGPTNYKNENQNMHEIMEATLDGLQRGARDFHMHTGLIVCGIRTHPELVKEAADLAAQYKGRGVVGFDIAGPENGNNPGIFRDAMRNVRERVMPITVHAGEVTTAAYIKEAFNELGAERVSHVVSAYQNPDLLEWFDSRRKALEICLTSNVHTGAVVDLGSHPFYRYFRSRFRTALSTDNPTISGTTITQEYLRAMHAYKLTQTDVFILGRHAIKAAFLSGRETREYLDQFDRYTATITGNTCTCHRHS
jgi:adenosine deaminase